MIIPNYFQDKADNLPPAQQEGQITPNASEVDPLLLNVSDEDLAQEINERLEKSESAAQALRTRQQSNRDYYLGDQLKSFDLLHWQMPSVENRIFMSVEVLIPMVTANPGDPDIHCLAEDENQEDEIANYIETVTSMLMYDYDVTYRIKNKLRQVIRNWFLDLVGVGKMRLDPLTNKPTFEVIDSRNMRFPSKDSPKNWKAEYKEDTLKDLLVMFPKAKDLLDKKYWKQGGEMPASILGTTIGYYEYWRPSFVAWKIDDDILDKRLNPNWDWKGENRQTTQEVIPQPDGSSIVNPVVDLYKYRILDTPRDPYFIFNHFTVSGLDYDDTGFIEQAKAPQDLVNKRKRQITAVADDAGILIGSGMGGQGIKKSEFDKYDGSPRSTMWIPDGNPNTVFARLTGGQVNTGMIEDLRDSRTAMDNTFGTQDITRGQNTSPNQSGVAQNIVRQGDISRIGPLAEAVEDFLQQVYLYDLQMRVLFTDYDYHIPQTTSADADQYQNRVFNRKKIPFIKVDELITIDGQESMESYMKPVPITLRVRRNSTLAKDENSEYQRMQADFKEGLTDPLTIYEKTGEANPVKKLERLFRWKNFPFTMLDDKIQQELMPLIRNPIPEPPKRTIRENIDVNTLPPDAQTGAIAEAGILKGEIDAIQLTDDLQQAQIQDQAQRQQQAEQTQQAHEQQLAESQNSIVQSNKPTPPPTK